MFALNIPAPGLDKDSLNELNKFIVSYIEASGKNAVRGGVISEGDAAAYALVWEWGNARQTKEGPKTVLGINPDGDSVWLSTQAPYGYIRIHEPELLNILQNELEAISFDKVKSDKDVVNILRKASATAASKMANFLQQVAPIDTGALRESIKAADPKDPDLAEDDETVELGNTHFTHVIRTMLKKLK